MSKHQVKLPNGETIELSTEELIAILPENWVAFDQTGAPPQGYSRTADFETRLQDRVSAAIQNGGYKKVEELIADDTFFKKAAQKRGISLDEEGKVIQTISPEIQRQMREELMEELVKPLQENFETAQKQVQELRQGNLREHFMRLATDPKKGFTQESMITLFDNDVPAPVQSLMGQMAWNESAGTWGVPQKMEDGSVAWRTKKNGELMGPDDLFNTLYDKRSKVGELGPFLDRKATMPDPANSGTMDLLSNATDGDSLASLKDARAQRLAKMNF